MIPTPFTGADLNDPLFYTQARRVHWTGTPAKMRRFLALIFWIPLLLAVPLSTVYFLDIPLALPIVTWGPVIAVLGGLVVDVVVISLAVRSVHDKRHQWDLLHLSLQNPSRFIFVQHRIAQLYAWRVFGLLIALRWGVIVFSTILLSHALWQEAMLHEILSPWEYAWVIFSANTNFAALGVLYGLVRAAHHLQTITLMGVMQAVKKSGFLMGLFSSYWRLAILYVLYGVAIFFFGQTSGLLTLAVGAAGNQLWVYLQTIQQPSLYSLPVYSLMQLPLAVPILILYLIDDTYQNRLKDAAVSLYVLEGDD